MTEKRIGRYEIIEEIGQGPLTAVFQAYDPHFEQPVALKIVRPGLMHNAAFVTHFKQNAKTLVRLQHPYIVPVYDFGEYDGRLALIMKWMKGGSLASRLGTPLPFEQTAQFIIQTAEGLTFASQSGLIHRHLHPGNILLDEDGSVAVADIGLTQMLGASSFGPSLGEADMGQSAYTAPEIWQGEAESESSDVYALGCLLFELITGNKLVQASNPAQAMQLHQESPHFPDQWPGQTPPEILSILQQAVAQDPAKRYPKASDLAADLTGLVKTWRKRYFGDYEVLEEIGVGGFAEVFRAYDRVNQQEVALKLILPFRMTDEDTRRFYREAKTISNLSHPHIVPVYAHGELNGRFYLVMELFRGGTLEDLLRAQGHLSLLQTATIIQDVAAGLDYAHQQNLIHRDIKPANVLLDENGTAVLADFGVVKALEHSTITMTTSGGIMGTPAYIAPEIWSGKEATPAVDTYALGCMVYEMMTGEQLHNATTLPAIIAKHLKPPEFPKNWMEDVPPDLVGILSIAMHQEPTKRYATVSDFSIALLKVADPLFEDYQSLEAAMQTTNWVQAIALAERIIAQGASYKDAAAYLTQAQQQQAEVEHQAAIVQVRSDIEAAKIDSQWTTVFLSAKQLNELDPNDSDANTFIEQAITQLEVIQIKEKVESAVSKEDWSQVIKLCQRWLKLSPGEPYPQATLMEAFAVIESQNTQLPKQEGDTAQVLLPQRQTEEYQTASVVSSQAPNSAPIKSSKAKRKIPRWLWFVFSIILPIIVIALVNQLVFLPNREVATIREKTITLADFQSRVEYERIQRVIFLENNLEVFNNDVGIIQQFAGQFIAELTPNNSNEFGKSILDEMINEQLIEQAAAERGIKVFDIDVDNKIGAEFGYYGGGLPTPLPTATETIVPTPSLTPIPTAVITEILPTATRIPPTVEPTSTPTATPVTEEAFQEEFSDFFQQYQDWGISEDQYREITRSHLLRDLVMNALAKEAGLPMDGEHANFYVIATIDEVEANEIADFIVTDGFLSVWNEIRSRPYDPELLSTAIAAELLRQTPDDLRETFGEEVAMAVFDLDVEMPSTIVTAVGQDDIEQYFIIMVSGREVLDLTESALNAQKEKNLLSYLERQRENDVTITDIWRGRVPTKPALDTIFFAQPTATPIINQQ